MSSRLLATALTILTALVAEGVSYACPAAHSCPDGSDPACGGELQDYPGRSWIVMLPNNQIPLTPRPLVFGLHGGSETASDLRASGVGTRMCDLVTDEGFVGVYPNGTNTGQGSLPGKFWNDCRASIPEVSDNTDDVGFLDAVRSRLVSLGVASPNRVFLWGVSNGGMLTYRAVRARAHAGLKKYSAAAAVIAPEPYSASRENSCSGSNYTSIDATSMLIMNGSADPVMPYNGSPDRYIRPPYVAGVRGQAETFDETRADWEALDGCPSPSSQALPDPNHADGPPPSNTSSVAYWDYGTCANGTTVRAYHVTNGGHTAPLTHQTPTEPIPGLGYTNRDIDAADTIWDFFNTFQPFSLDPPAPGNPPAVPIRFLRVGSAVEIVGNQIPANSVLKIFVTKSDGTVLDVVPNGVPKTSINDTTWKGTLPWHWPISAPDDTTLGRGFATLMLVGPAPGYVQSNVVSIPLVGNASAAVTGGGTEIVPSLESVVVGGNTYNLAATSWDPNVAFANFEVALPKATTITVRGQGFSSPRVNVFDTSAAGSCHPAGGVVPTNVQSTSFDFQVPNGCVIGAGSIQVVNATGSYLGSNVVSAPIGEAISLSSISKSSCTITVNGTGFSQGTTYHPGTVINLFATVGGSSVNLGGTNADGSAKIPLTVNASAHSFTFTQPGSVDHATNVTVQPVNSPFTPFTTVALPNANAVYVSCT